MTAKERLRRKVETLSEREAADALAVLERSAGRDPLDELLNHAPPDDEPVTAEEAAAVAEARAEVERGETVPLEQLRYRD